MQTIKLLVLVAVATILSACNNGSDTTTPDTIAPDTIAPVITLTGSSIVTVEAGSVYTDAGASASDNSDGNITTGIATVNPVNAAVVGAYTVTYNVSDLAGNAATQVTRTVNVVDTTAPVISLSGTTPVSINVNNAYIDAGASASDNLDGDITGSIVTVNPVNTGISGSYTVTYNVSDANGNAATEVTRTVNVVTPPVADTTAPVITLSGTSPVSVPVGGSYTDAGATATDNVDDSSAITANIVTVNPVNAAVVGSYTVTYDVSDAAGNPATQVTRTVNVVDTTAPVITLIGLSIVTVEAGSAYSDAGATALDNVDGNITTNIVPLNLVNTAVVGTYSVTYNVSDAAGNPATEVTRTVDVVDTTAPVITLSGSSPVSVEGNSTYSDAGATATDNVDDSSAITANIVTVNPVNTGTLGSYTMTYNVSDANGNAATPVTRTVNVVDTTAPVITLSGTSPVSVTVGGSYTDAGATASDNFNGDISGSIVVAGNTVDTANAGSYVITYNVSDGAGNAASQVTRTVNVTVVVGVVMPYYSAAPNWNDYVKNDNTTRFNATNTPADGAETGGYSALIHGGEMRSVNIGVTSCTDQAATDALGAFNWVCDDSSGSALMVSTGLKKDKNLADLLDFATQVWKNNSVTVTGTGSLTTASSAWWSNPVTLANAGGSLATAGSVYLITANPAAAYTVDASKIALIIQPGVTVFGPATSKDIIVTNTQSYLWFEGTVDVTGDNYGLLLSTVSFSVLRNLFVNNANFDGINVNSSSVNNILSNITSSNNGSSGIEINGGSNSTLSNITAANNSDRGVQILNSSYNILSDINVSNNGQGGFEILSGSNNVATNIRAVRSNRGVNISSDNNLLSNLTVSENDVGLGVSGASNNTFLNVTASNNWTYGLNIIGVNTILSNITVTNTQSVGLQFTGLNNSVSNLAAVNNKYIGIRAVTFGDNYHFSNTAAVNNGRGIGFANGAKNNIFTGLLKVGGNSVVDCGDDSATTFSDASCTAVAPSDFTLTSGVTAADSFVAKVTTDDTANTSDTNGSASFPADITTFDWFNFDNIFRAWGSDGSAFPNIDNTDNIGNGYGWTANTGRIWDWSMANGDTGDAGNPVLQNVLTLPSNGNAANTIEHVWSGTAADQAACSALVPGSVWNAIDDCRSTYLRNASEIVGDNIGNDNGLCETDETCLYTPNIGSYQGHGALISGGAFTDGDTLTGITLMKYTTNGY